MSGAFARALAAACLTILIAATADARLVRFVVEHREMIPYKGTGADAGPYEKLTGHFWGELDPRDTLNGVITDIALAPRNARGLVEYSATFSMAVPTDLKKSSGVLVYLVPNRGSISVDGGPSYLGDFRRQGHVIVASGWQGDLAPAAGRETISVPVAKNADGSSITGPVLARFADMAEGATTLPIVRGRLQKTATPASLDTSRATLTRRAAEGAKVIPIRNTDWAFADCTKVAFPGTPDPDKVCIKGGFDPAYLYELAYTAKDPLVLGIGFAATRDLNAFLRNADRDDTGGANVLGRTMRFAVSQGNSQSGNFLRSFLHLGFNQDESGRRVFDGMNPNISVRQLAMNIRFAAPGGAVDLYEPGSEGTLWYGTYGDDVRNRPAGSVLDRCAASDTCPRIVETFGASEFFGLRASPDLVGTRADRDIPLPASVRRYYFPGVSHGGGPGGFDATTPKPPACCELPANVNPSNDTMRAVMAALVEWVVKGTPPPPSQYPRFDHGDLVPPTQAAMGFPSIPGMPVPDGILNPLYDYDLGPEFHYADVSGVITKQPPVIRQILPMLVPRVDADGNETAGVPSVLHQVPLGTYTGWNITAQGYSKGRIYPQPGSFIPFAKTKAERMASGDPRPSLEERYSTHEKYVSMVRAAAERMVRDRFLLKEDAERLIAEADRSNVLRH